MSSRILQACSALGTLSMVSHQQRWWSQSRWRAGHTFDVEVRGEYKVLGNTVRRMCTGVTAIKVVLLLPTISYYGVSPYQKDLVSHSTNQPAGEFIDFPLNCVQMPNIIALSTTQIEND